MFYKNNTKDIQTKTTGRTVYTNRHELNRQYGISSQYRQEQSTKLKDFLTASQLQNENQKLKNQNKELKQQLYQSINQNVILLKQIQFLKKNKEFHHIGQDQTQFVKQCQFEIQKLKKLVRDLSQQKNQGSTERQEIKDRIIMKLEDQLISTKILLKETNFKINQSKKDFY